MLNMNCLNEYDLNAKWLAWVESGFFLNVVHVPSCQLSCWTAHILLLLLLAPTILDIPGQYWIIFLYLSCVLYALASNLSSFFCHEVVQTVLKAILIQLKAWHNSSS